MKKKINTNLPIVITKLPFTLEQIKEVYSGKPGCACGCRGKYYPCTEEMAKEKGYITEQDRLDKKDGFRKNKKMIKRVYAIFLKYLNLNKVYVYPGWNNKIFALDIHEDRTYTIYL